MEFEIDITFTNPILLPAGHYFFRPEVLVTGGDFLYLSGAETCRFPWDGYRGRFASVDPERRFVSRLASNRHRHHRRSCHAHVQHHVYPDWHHDSGPRNCRTGKLPRPGYPDYQRRRLYWLKGYVTEIGPKSSPARHAYIAPFAYSHTIMRGAFVVQLGPETKPAKGQFEGSVHEVDSCTELRFCSTEELLKFMGQCFDLAMASADKTREQTTGEQALSRKKTRKGKQGSGDDKREI